ncbi:MULTISPECIES: hypothetical protein [unclassified Synechococcus]|uniref:hypothetical protein n=1 Tax=unclassified Synechococcus TaxID=2626047 RepID=UPI0008FF7580|nr:MULTISPECIES: hypothetical protein [unclassified Synechococcus]APD47801.1 hypothetical protein BM449_05410 [Synechococcus sp. SynAce01]MCT0245104.1 hypothetical protein [Synechococcus sp. CS-601]MCT4364607.1 hypothetical protein [Candidatus Regnicoccus frigidus MAG-AL1]TWB89755.1 hypothetical protein FB106_11275 [Synechococcus sp. Ace-Pa]
MPSPSDGNPKRDWCRTRDLALGPSRFHWQSQCLGFADYVSHEGERPLAIRWRLQGPIPGAFYPELAVAV